MNAKEAAEITKRFKNTKEIQLDKLLARIKLEAYAGHGFMYWDEYIDPHTEESLKALGYDVMLSGNIYWDQHL